MTEQELERFCLRIGRDMKNMRVMRGLSQVQACEQAGISRRTLCRLEDGDMGIAIGTVAKLAKLYDAPDSFLRVIGVSSSPAPQRESPSYAH